MRSWSNWKLWVAHKTSQPPGIKLKNWLELIFFCSVVSCLSESCAFGSLKKKRKKKEDVCGDFQGLRPAAAVEVVAQWRDMSHPVTLCNKKQRWSQSFYYPLNDGSLSLLSLQSVEWTTACPTPPPQTLSIQYRFWVTAINKLLCLRRTQSNRIAMTPECSTAKTLRSHFIGLKLWG